MSFKDFENGITGPTFQQQMEQQRQEEARAREQELLKRFKESEHVLNILRSVAPSKVQEDEVFKKWLKAVHHN